MYNRRKFIQSLPLIVGGASVMGFPAQKILGNTTQDSNIPTRRKIHLFSKHLQWLDYNPMAELSAEMGFDGIDLTVRPKGHVLPENAVKDLPLAVQAIRINNLVADRITTSLTDPDSVQTLKVLETAANAGIKYYRFGWFPYDFNVSIEENIKVFKDVLFRFSKLNKEFGICGVYQNHSSSNFIGSPVWDIGLLLEGVDLDHIAVQYDIRHAVAEGGQSWPIGMQYLKDKINCLIIKDFIWSNDSGTWKPKSVPLGKGMVDFKRYFHLVSKFNSSADFSLHYEYEGLGGAEHGASQLTIPENQVKEKLKRDLDLLKTWI